MLVEPGPSTRLFDKKSVLLGSSPRSYREISHCHSTKQTCTVPFSVLRLKGRVYGNANNGSMGFHRVVAIDFTGIMIHVRNQFRILVPGNGCTLEKCGSRLRTGCLLFDAGVEWRLSFLPTVGCSWPVPSPAPTAASRESRLQPRIYAITAPLPPPMLQCVSVYGYRFPVASSFQSQHRDTMFPSSCYRFHRPIGKESKKSLKERRRRRRRRRN